MKHIYRFWTCVEKDGSKYNGYSEADITFQADAVDDDGKEWYGKVRKTLNAAVNDAKRYYARHQAAYFSIYANATLTEYRDDGTQDGKAESDSARIGSLTPSGEFFDLCESVEWMEKAD